MSYIRSHQSHLDPVLSSLCALLETVGGWGFNFAPGVGSTVAFAAEMLQERGLGLGRFVRRRNV